MGEGQMNIIYQFFMNVPDNLLMNYTDIEQVNLPWSRFREDSIKKDRLILKQHN
jgi:hypothetical protein